MRIKKGWESNRLFMTNKNQNQKSSGVDKGLVAMFLNMSPEERLKANDNAVRAILELRRAFKQQKYNKRGLKRNH